MNEIIGLQQQINAIQRELDRLRSADKVSRRWEGSITGSAGTANPFGTQSGGYFAGLFIVVELTGGHMAAFLTGGTQCAKIGESTANVFTTTAGTGSRMNVYLDGSYNVVIQNNLDVAPTARSVYVQGFPIRSQN